MTPPVRRQNPAAYEVTRRLLAGESLAEAEAYWGLTARRLRRMVMRVCAEANPVLYARLCRKHFVLQALRQHQIAVGFGLPKETP